MGTPAGRQATGLHQATGLRRTLRAGPNLEFPLRSGSGRDELERVIDASLLCDRRRLSSFPNRGANPTPKPIRRATSDEGAAGD